MENENVANPNYVQHVYDLLDAELNMRGSDFEDLLETYGLLVLTVGEHCTNEHIHDAWSVWQNKTMPGHRSIKWFNELTKEVQDLDEPYRIAVVKVSKMINAE